jgi:hypothetical protein
VLFGRPHKLTPLQRREAIARRDAGETLMDIGRSYGVSHSTISSLSARGKTDCNAATERARLSPLLSQPSTADAGVFIGPGCA